ncbi:hypothetical protein DYB28_009332 [Aphanomyces astaci]|uniref:Uncharacterized protein n=1 Tax=Aphanomyces astaci TaxID=112090 RepID=A0A9X8E8D6_APHAT|nr:hypothetical protein DYB28_009332 [Aphanomyces astaci]
MANEGFWRECCVVSVRQDDWGGAEMALTEANVLDRTYADVWGLSNGFVSLDKLEVAESFLRGSLLAGDSSLTRKTLEDVLATHSSTSTALEQYKKVVEGCNSMGDRATLLARCANLLSMLGRLEEAKEYLDIAQHQQQGADKEALIGRQVQQHHHRVDGP